MSVRKIEWIFLNLFENKDNGEVDKLKIAEEVDIIERWANAFGCNEIICNGSDCMLKIREEVNSDESLKDDLRINKLTKKKPTSGSSLSLIKDSLGI